MARTELKDVGEFGLINRLNTATKILQPSTHKGIGDDAAVLDYGGELFTLVSTDLLIEGVHFDLSYFPLKHLGYKAVSVNVSDIAAMNGTPTQITVSLAISNRFSVEALEELYAGIYLACEDYGIDLIGGDTTSSLSGLMISITALGQVAKDKVVYRNGAQKGDILCVTGDLGGAYLGLQILSREKEVFLANPEMQPQLTGLDYLVGRQLRPEARTNIIHELQDLELVPTSMIDISDGLASEILHICQQSGVGAFVFEDKIPIDKMSYETAIEFNIAPTTCALNGGEDYELLFTIKQSEFEKIKTHPNISTIGYIVDKSEGTWLKTRGDNEVKITAQGWTHF
jgi:thiamine-monophosphate kinase